MKSDAVVSIVVTYNRKNLLIECLEAILNQTYDIHKIILIDNASTDGTEAKLKDEGFLDNNKIIYHKMEINTGGSGGFFEGLKLARQLNCDWIWLMDDDTIPTNNCLEELINANSYIESQDHSVRRSAFLASAIYGPNGEFMNLPKVSERKSDNGYAYWYQFLKNGIVGIECATFVSVLIKKEAVEACGLPCKDYFIWGDDSEYTLRLSTFYGEGYFIGSSTAIHKRIGAKALNIEYETNPSRIKMFHYLYRNSNINNRFYNHKNKIQLLIKGLVEATRFLFKPMGIAKCKAILRGNFEAVLQYGKFRSYIEGELKNNL